MAFRCALALVGASLGLVLAVRPPISGNRPLRNPQLQPFMRASDLQDKINGNYEALDVFSGGDGDGNQQPTRPKSMPSAMTDDQSGSDVAQPDAAQYRENSSPGRRIPASRSRNQLSSQGRRYSTQAGPVQESEMNYSNAPRSFANINRKGVYYNGAYSSGYDNYSPASYNSAPVASKYTTQSIQGSGRS